MISSVPGVVLLLVLGGCGIIGIGVLTIAVAERRRGPRERAGGRHVAMPMPEPGPSSESDATRRAPRDRGGR